MAKNPIDKLQKNTEAVQSVDQSHLSSVSELVALNRMAFDRAKHIIGLGNNGRLSPPIMLREFVAGENDMAVIGFISIHKFKQGITTLQSIHVSYYTINRHQLEEIQEKYEATDTEMCIDDDQAASTGIYEIMGRSEDSREHQLGLGISTDGEHLDEINTKTRTVAAKRFMPVRALNIGINKRNTTQKMKKLDVSIERLEVALDDYELNPEHADGMEKTLQAIQNLPETSE